MDTFSEPTPEEIRLATIQFMGQHLMGDLKELNKNIVSQNQTLRGMTIDPERIVNTIPHPRVARPAMPHNPMHTTVNAGINVQHAPAPSPQPVVNHSVEVKEDPDQLTFNFKQTDIDDIYYKLDIISKKLDKLLNND